MSPVALILGFLVTVGALLATDGARANGALAIGDCGAYGYSINYNTESEARTRALSECRSHGGKNCKVATTMRGNCVAFSTDRSRSCGAWGWATRASRSEAETAANEQCRKFGGSSCRIRTQICDVPPAPALTTNWTATTLRENECLERAERVVKDAGLTKNFEKVGQSVFGEVGDYTAQVRCISEKEVVVFVIVGPTLDQARVHMKAIFEKF
jgi:hypothetical protein